MRTHRHRRLGLPVAVALAALALPAVAAAAGPGDTLLVSGPPGLAPDTFAWNVSGNSLAEDEVTSIGVSADGTRVAFLSDAPILVPGDSGRDKDTFVADVATGLVNLVTPGTTLGVDEPVISGNGQFVAFSTSQPLLAPDVNATQDVTASARTGRTSPRESMRATTPTSTYGRSGSARRRS